jgi:hypothetical protein
MLTASSNRSLRFQIPVLGACVLWVAAVVIQRTGFELPFYPFLFPDSFDWIVNGYYYAGILPGVVVTHRSVFFPYITSVAVQLGLENILPFFGTFFWAFGAFSVYLILRKIFPVSALYVAVFFLFSAQTMGQSAYIGCDVAASVVFSISALLLIRFAEAERDREVIFQQSLLLAALSFNIQPFTPIVYPFLLAVVFRDRALPRLTPRLILVIIICGLLVVLPQFPRIKQAGLFSEAGLRHASLLGFAPQQLGFYVLGLVSQFSLVGTALGLFGAIRLFRRRRLPAMIFITWFFATFLFFSLFYTWPDVRFLIYLSIPVFIFLSEGIVALCGRRPVPELATVIFFAFILQQSAAENPVENRAVFFPGYALGSNDGSFSRIQTSLQAQLLREEAVVQFQKHDVSHGEMELPGYSSAVHRIGKLLEKRGEALDVASYEPVPRHTAYVIENRNMLLLRRPAVLLTTPGDLAAYLRSKPLMVLVREANQKEFDEIRRREGVILKHLERVSGWFLNYTGPGFEPIGPD